MSLMLRRYAKSTGYAQPWLYALFAAGFAALAVWAGVQQQWFVLVVAVAMLAISVAAVPITRRLARGLAASNEALIASPDRSRDPSQRG